MCNVTKLYPLPACVMPEAVHGRWAAQPAEYHEKQSRSPRLKTSLVIGIQGLAAQLQLPTATRGRRLGKPG